MEVSADLAKKNQEPSECKKVWIQIRPDVLSGLIWVQTVCKRQSVGELAYIRDDLTKKKCEIWSLQRLCIERKYSSFEAIGNRIMYLLRLSSQKEIDHYTPASLFNATQ